VEDIIGLLGHLDQRCKLNAVQFVAVNLARLPKYGPEEINICCLADKQAHMEVKLTGLYQRVEEFSQLNLTGPVASSIHQSLAHIETSVKEAIQQKSDAFQAQISQLSLILESTVKPQSLSQPVYQCDRPAVKPSGRIVENVDRSRNVVIFGIEESRETTEWRNAVCRALNTAAGTEVIIDDAFRLGKLSPGRNRLILVKMHFVWDKRTTE